MTWVNGVGFEIEAAADDSIIKFGGTAHIDVVWYNKSSTNDMGWIADTSTLQLSGAAILSFGGAAILTADDGFHFAWDDGTTLNIDPTNANDIFRIGETTVADFHLDGAATDLIWNASDNALIANDSTEICFGTALDVYMRWENSGSTLDIGQTSDGTGSIDFIDIQAVFTGADSAGTLLTLASIDASTNSDTFVITHTGTGSAIKITGADTDHTAQIELVGAAAQTTPYLWLDGDTAGFNGADNIGMITIANDTPLIHNGATLLSIDNSGQIKDGAEGGLARFINTGTARADAVVVEIAGKDSTEVGLNVSAGQVKATAHRFIVTDRKATNTGATTGTIAQGTDFIQCDTTTADDLDIVLLPTAVAGTVMYILNDDAAQDFELTAAASDKINGGSAAGASTVGEGVLVRLVAVTNELWIATQFAANGTESALDASA